MRQLTTVIIDDEWLIRSELQGMLEQLEGIDIIGEAGNFSEAFQLLKEKKPDLVFLDIQMPGGSGFDLLRKFNGDFKVVFISAFHKYMREAKGFKAEAYLLKPIRMDQLTKVIHKIIHG